MTQNLYIYYFPFSKVVYNLKSRIEIETYEYIE